MQPALKADNGRPSRETLVARATALKPLLAAHAAETEKSGRIPDAVVEALRAAGMFRMTSPQRFGGYQVPFRTLVEVGTVLAEVCGSAAWVVGYANTAKWMASLWSAEAQEDVFRNGPDFAMAGSGYKPSEDVQRVEGGYRFSGTWPSLSSAPYADWIGVWIKLPEEEGQPGKIVEALIPQREVTIKNTWAVAGMRNGERICRRR